MQNKFIVTSVMCIVSLLAAIPGECANAPSVKIFRGTYSGNCTLDATDGTSIFYSPLRLSISAKGVIKGTALKSDTAQDNLNQTTVSATGQLQTPKKYSQIKQTRSSSKIKLSDGAVLKLVLAHLDLAGLAHSLQNEEISATIRIGDYLGDCSLIYQD